MTTASLVCCGVVLTSSRLNSASSASIRSDWIGWSEHWQVEATVLVMVVSGTGHQFHRLRCRGLTSHVGYIDYVWSKVERWLVDKEERKATYLF